MVQTNHLKLRMQKYHLTQQNVADALGLAQSTVSLKLRGIRSFTLDEAVILGRLLQLKPDEFRAYFFVA